MNNKQLEIFGFLHLLRSVSAAELQNASEEEADILLPAVESRKTGGVAHSQLAISVKVRYDYV